MEIREHWEIVHEENGPQDVSWFQQTPRASLAWFDELKIPREARVLDVGCGQWGLAPALVERGYTRVSALDLSAAALRRARDEMGKAGEAIEWIEGDALELTVDTPFDVWHDRAVLHFFTTTTDIERYAASVRRNLTSRGHAILATFARDGPESCSGLPVLRHGPDSIAEALGPEFELVASLHEKHVTPWGTPQSFQWAVLRRS